MRNKKILISFVVLFCGVAAMVLLSQKRGPSSKIIVNTEVIPAIVGATEGIEENSKSIKTGQANGDVRLQSDADRTIGRGQALRNQTAESNSASATSKLNDVFKSCSFSKDMLETSSLSKFLQRFGELKLDSKCKDAISKTSIHFDFKTCANSLTSDRTNITKYCRPLVSLYAIYNAPKDIKHGAQGSMSDKELVWAYVAIMARNQDDISSFKLATEYVLELLKRHPNDVNVIQMLAKASMLSNESGVGYEETLSWLKRGIELEPGNVGLWNHYLQRLSYGDDAHKDELKRIYMSHRDDLSTIILYGAVTIQDRAELAKFYASQAKEHSHHAEKLTLASELSASGKPFVFRVLDFRVNDIPSFAY
jgi:hypothetical protein